MTSDNKNDPTIQWLSVDQLKPHPKNPRLALRQDVVDAIAAQLAEAKSFDPAHAPLVRPVNGHYEILAGHHRQAGAVKAGVEKVPCWVRELDDDAAYMALVTSNAQGELSPLEIGLHALGCIQKGKAGRGKKGGLSAYAEKIGKSQSHLSELVGAAEVARAAIEKSIARAMDLADPEHPKTKHLTQLHTLPEELWADAVAIFLKLKTDDSDEWTVELTEQRVRAAKAHLADESIGVSWRHLFLPHGDCARSILSEENSPKNFSQLFGIAASTAGILAGNDELLAEYRGWLSANIGGDSWDVRVMEAKRKEMEERVSTSTATIHVGDWQTWFAKQDEADLVLTDPPYSTDVEDIQGLANDLVSAATAKVKKSGRVFICIGAYPDELKAYLNAPYDTSRVTLEQVLVWTYRNTLGPSPTRNYKLNWQAILYYRGVDAPPLDCPVMTEQFAVQDINAPDGRQGDRFYVWQKPDELAERLVRHTTQPGQLVLDPFAGSGSFVLAAARLGRIGKGCELKEDVVSIAEGRGCRRESTAGTWTVPAA